MEVWLPSLFGLGGVILGAVITLAGQMVLADRELTRRRTGITKALLTEVRLNFEEAWHEIKLGHPFEGYSDKTWVAAIFEAAEFLEDTAYRAIEYVYAVLPILRQSPLESESGKAREDSIRAFGDWMGSAFEVEEHLLNSRYASSFRSEWSPLLDIDRAILEELKTQMAARSGKLTDTQPDKD